ncbi:MAG: DUF6475 domain-containing protein [Pseudomonadota bacterium]
MLENDKKSFLQCLTLLAESFNRKVSSLLLETYWQGLKAYPFEQVKQAMLSTLQNPDRKWGMPNPGDLIASIQGDSRSHALKAWSQVVTAIRMIGRYDSVVFDNPLIHCVIRDMGGWIYLCQQPEKELPFLRYEFEKRYHDYQGKPLLNYPRSLKGSLEHDNQVQGFSNQSDPVLIGNTERALTVYNNGVKQPSTKPLSLSQASHQLAKLVQSEEEN